VDAEDVAVLQAHETVFESEGATAIAVMLVPAPTSEPVIAVQLLAPSAVRQSLS